MTEPTDRQLWTRYLRQRVGLGLTEFYLDRTTPVELEALLRQRLRRDSEASRGGVAVSGTGSGISRSATGTEDPTFEEFRNEVLGCTLCRLAEGRNTVVFGEGDSAADLMAVGEAPGREEDRTGRPFVGAAGQLLDRMLAAIGFARSEVFICNVLKCRPPGNRDPWPDEVASCRPYLRRQIEFIRPKAICAFGRFAAQTLLGSEQSLRRLRGTAHELMGVPVVVTYHPAALLRNRAWKRDAWEDLKMLRRIYDEAGGRAPRGPDG